MPQKRIEYIDYLETIAIILVVNIHHLSLLGDSMLANLMKYWSVVAVPLFFMANGMLFFTKKFSFQKHITKIIYLLLGSMVWKLLIILAMIAISKGQLRWTIQQILSELVGINIYEPYIPTEQFWFTYTLVGIYIVAPLFRHIYENYKNAYIAYTIFTFVFIMLAKEIPVLNYIKEIVYPFALGGNYITYFLIGPLLHEIGYEHKERKAMKIAISVMAIIAGYGWICHIMFTTEQNLVQQYQSVGTFAVVCGMYVIAAAIDWKDGIVKKIMEIISVRTMGIFAIHMFVSYYVIEMIQKATPATGIKMHLSKTAIVFVISLIITEIISYIPVLRKVLGVTHNVNKH